jgi:hypothetical protein
VLYEQGRVRHVGAFPELEDEMADFAASGLSAGRSPDRLDALVWGADPPDARGRAAHPDALSAHPATGWSTRSGNAMVTARPGSLCTAMVPSICSTRERMRP